VSLRLAGTCIASLFLAVAANASGTAGRAFVSISGVDNASCSTTSPCRTFGAALAALAPAGEIVVQTSGGYGPFTITQSVTIDAAGVNASITAGTGVDACTINAAGARVVLRGISFHGGNAGHDAINATSVSSLYVEHCSITEFNNDGIDMQSGGNLFITGTDFRACDFGVDLETSSEAAANLVAHDCRFAECCWGINLETNGSSVASAMVSNCDVSLCTSSGFQIVSRLTGAVTMTCTNCRAINNEIGFFANADGLAAATILLTNCIATQNGAGVITSSTMSALGSVTGTSPGSNIISGNTSGNTITDPAVTQQ
jgi:hypothetical protein